MRRRFNKKKPSRKSTKGANKHSHRTRIKRQSRSLRISKTRRLAPRTAKEFFAMPLRAQDQWTRMTHVITKVKAGDSLRKASREFGLDPRTVVKQGRSALLKLKNGRYIARASDQLLRVLALPVHDGTREFATRDSRVASLIAEYWNAVHRYLETGDATALRRFRGKRVKDVSGKKILLLTDLNELDRLGGAGVFSFESIYAKTA